MRRRNEDTRPANEATTFGYSGHFKSGRNAVKGGGERREARISLKGLSARTLHVVIADHAKLQSKWDRPSEYGAIS